MRTSYHGPMGYRHEARKPIFCSRCKKKQHAACDSIHCTCMTCRKRYTVPHA